MPADILCIGLNYRRHAEEGKQAIPEWPVLFMKTSSAVQHPGDPIVLPTKLASDAGRLRMRAGRGHRQALQERRLRRGALDYVLGHACANDVSAASCDWQMKKGGTQWCRGKTFATFRRWGRAWSPPDEIPNPEQAFQIRTVLETAEAMQDWELTDDMIFDVPTLIEFLSGSTLLVPGTVILTGTPHGVGGAEDAAGLPQAGGHRSRSRSRSSRAR